MRKHGFLIIISALLVMCLVACSTTAGVSTDTENLSTFKLGDNDEYYGDVFGQGDITSINITISETDWNDLIANPLDETYYPVDITINGVTYENVGFKTKGNSSLTSIAQSDSNRYGFTIKADEFVEGQTINGLDQFVLNPSFADASYMREFLTYAASAYLGMITPNVSYTNLSINDELFGFYLTVEAYEDSFVERISTVNETTNLYKADEENCTLLTTDDLSGYRLEYGSDESFTNLTTLINTLNNTTADNTADLEAILDVDSVLKAIALNTVMGNYDSYSGSKAHNYYLLYSDGKFTYLPWDYNMSIGGYSEDSGASVTVDIDNPFYNVDSSTRPLFAKLLAIDEYKTQYLSYVNDLIAYLNDFTSLVTQVQTVIGSSVENDPTAFYTYDQFITAISVSDTDLSALQPTALANGFGSDQTDMTTGATEQTDTENAPTDQNTTDDKTSDNNSAPADMPDKTKNGEQPTGPATNENGQNTYPTGNSLLSSTACSILDYIQQRIAEIQSQLSAS